MTNPKVRLDKDPPAAGGGPYVGSSTPFDSIGAGDQRSGFAAAPSSSDLSQLSDANTRKIIAALLAFFLGGLGIHKFYLGYTGAGLVFVLIQIAGWFLTLMLSLLSLGIGAIFLLPLMAFASGVLSVIGIIEGVIYLSKTDADFYHTYLSGRKEWF